MVDATKPREIFPFIVITILFFAALYLGFHNQTLNHKNKELSERSKTLENSLKQTEELLAKSQNENGSVQKALQKLKNEYESFKVEYQKIDTQWKAAAEEKTYLEEMLINKNKAIEILKKNPSQDDSASQNDSSAVSDDLVEQIRQKDEEIKKLDEQNKILGEKLESLYKTTQSKISEINVAKIALEETISAARAKIDEEWATVNLGSISMNKDGVVKKEARKTSKSEGRVLALNEEQGFVVVDLGKVDNLRNDTSLQVRIDNEVIATLSILEIRDEMSACNIKNVRDGMKLKINDRVFIQ